MSNLNQICIHKHEIFWINKINSKYYSFVLSVSNKFDVTYIIHIRQTNSIHICNTYIHKYVYTTQCTMHLNQICLDMSRKMSGWQRSKHQSRHICFWMTSPQRLVLVLQINVCKKICFHFNGKVQNY